MAGEVRGRNGFVDAEGWNFVDWTAIDDRAAGGAVQAWYLEAMDAFVNLSKECGETEETAKYAGKAKRLRASIVKHFWSNKRGAFLKYPSTANTKATRLKRPDNVPPNLIGQHENFSFARL